MLEEESEEECESESDLYDYIVDQNQYQHKYQYQHQEQQQNPNAAFSDFHSSSTSSPSSSKCNQKASISSSSSSRLGSLFLPQSHERVIIHIDIDCFYAQVEMMHDESLRNKPIGIQQKYLLVTCNYIARKYGVRKLQSLKEAKRLCPEIIIINGEDLDKYREASQNIFHFLVSNFTPKCERLGFDETFLDITELVNKSIEEEKVSICKESEGNIPLFDIETQLNGKSKIYLSSSKSKKRKSHEEEEDGITWACTCGCIKRLIHGANLAFKIRNELYK